MKRRLLKCDLCTYSNITDVNSRDDDKPMRYHIFKEHLSSKVPSREEDNFEDEYTTAVIHGLLNDIIHHIECGMTRNTFTVAASNKLILTDYYFFRCNQCPGVVTFERKAQLNKHMKIAHAECLNRLKCVYCSKLFEIKSIGDYLNHLKANHKQFIINDLLLNKKSFNRIIFDNSIDWSQYFESETVNDNLGPPGDSGIRYSFYLIIQLFLYYDFYKTNFYLDSDFKLF